MADSIFVKLSDLTPEELELFTAVSGTGATPKEVALKYDPGDDDLTIQAKKLRCLGDIAVRIVDLGAAAQYFQRALALFTQLDDRPGQAGILRRQGELALRGADVGSAARHYQDALALFKQIDAKLGHANTLVRQANLLDAQGQLDTALSNFDLALAAFRSMGDVYSEAVALGSLGELWLRHDRAEDGYRVWANRVLLVVSLQPILFTQMAARTIRLAKGHARSHPDQATAGCAALLQTLEPSLEEARRKQNRQSASLLAVTLGAFRVIGLVAAALVAQGDERRTLLEQARTQAAQVDQATKNVFALAAWIDELAAS